MKGRLLQADAAPGNPRERRVDRLPDPARSRTFINEVSYEKIAKKQV